MSRRYIELTQDVADLILYIESLVIRPLHVKNKRFCSAGQKADHGGSSRRAVEPWILKGVWVVEAEI